MVETVVGGVDNIPIVVKETINATHLREENCLLSYKADISSTVNTLNKIIMARDVSQKYVSKYYDDFLVEYYNLEFKTIVNQYLD